MPSDTLTTSHSVSTAQGGVTRDRLPSNICHRGNREDKLHLIHTRRIVSLSFRPAVMEVSERRVTP